MSSMRTLLHPAGADLALPNILYALGEPARLQIVEELAAELGSAETIGVLAASTAPVATTTKTEGASA